MKTITSIFILTVLTIVYSCTSERKVSSQKLSLVCGDLFSKYAKKPVDLEFVECSTGIGQQTLLEAKYIVSNENADEVEKLLVKNYGIMEFCDYYHSMPVNKIILQPEELLEIDPFYILVIDVTHTDIEMLVYNGCKSKRNKEFFVSISILSV